MQFKKDEIVRLILRHPGAPQPLYVVLQSDTPDDATIAYVRLLWDTDYPGTHTISTSVLRHMTNEDIAMAILAGDLI